MQPFAILPIPARNGQFALSQGNNQLMNRGTLAAAGAYCFWGVLPLYWRLLAQQRCWHWLLRAVRSPRIMLTFCSTAGLLAAN